LARLAAKHATLIADELMKLGSVRQAWSWFATARDAAEEADDAVVLSWISVGEGMLTFHYSEPQRAVELARQAQGRLRQAGPSCAAAAALEARALACLGQTAGAEAALRRADALAERLDDAGRSDVAYEGFPARRLHFYAGSALAFLGQVKRAWAQQQEALRLYPATALDATLIHFDRAGVLARSHEAEEACRLAGDALLGLPVEHRTALVLRRARDVVQAVPQARRQSAAVQEYRELLAAAG
jgi:hypothetical protein